MKELIADCLRWHAQWCLALADLMYPQPSGPASTPFGQMETEPAPKIWLTATDERSAEALAQFPCQHPYWATCHLCSTVATGANGAHYSNGTPIGRSPKSSGF